MEEWLAISESAKILKITDKALYKRISNESSNESNIKKINSKTCVNEEYLDKLKLVIRKKNNSTSKVIHIKPKSTLEENTNSNNESGFIQKKSIG